MLSIGKLVAGAENYYLSVVASGREDYYVGAGEAPGRWLGAGATRLGLAGEVTADELRMLLAGWSPNGERLTSRPTGSVRVAGFDLTFSAPKSVSILWGLSEAPVSEAVRRAHDDAVVDALGYLERHATQARRGHNGVEQIAADGVVAAAFRHRSSRAGDPQLHTHVLVANAVPAADGRWSAPDARLLYFHARTAGFLYQAALRARLVEALGVRFGPVERGSAEVAGVGEELVRAFSRRRAAIETALERHGTSSPRAAEVAALATRPVKGRAMEGEPTGVSLADSWRARATELGCDLAGLDRAVGVPLRVELGPAIAEELAERLLGPHGLTAQVSTFERRDVVREVAGQLPDGAHVTVVESIADAVLAREPAVTLGATGPGGEQLRSTTDLLTLERWLLSEGERRRSERTAVVDPVIMRAVLGERSWLAGEQAELVRRLTGSGHGLDAVVGKAGSGKTSALEAARGAWARAGFTVTGTALAAKAATELQAATGITSDTYSALLARLERGERVFTARTVLVVDEAGMVGTRHLARVIDAAGMAGTKVVLIGDHRQLPEIEAGGAFAALVGRLPAVELMANRRQERRWERAVLDELRAGDVSRAVDAYLERGRLHVAASATDARHTLVAHWALSREDGTEVTMLAARRAEVEELNRLARLELRRRGRLGEDAIEGGGRGFALHDEIVCLRNDRRLGVRNGTRGRIVDAGERFVVIASDDGEHRLPRHYLDEGLLAHGYATTIHKAQGTTVERAFVLATGNLSRESGYVAMSRARTRTDLYVVEGGQGITVGGTYGPDAPDELRRALSTSRAKHLASSYGPPEDPETDRVRGLRR